MSLGELLQSMSGEDLTSIAASASTFSDERTEFGMDARAFAEAALKLRELGFRNLGEAIGEVLAC